MTGTAKRTSRPSSEPASEEVPFSDSPFSGNGAPDIADVAPPIPKSKAETELILKSLLASYVGIGTAVSVFSRMDGVIIVQNAEDLTESWRQLLDNDPKLRRIMKRAIQGSGWGAVISAHLMVAVPIIHNHSDGFSHLIKRKSAPSDAE